jgi:hypothetical protein
MLTYADVCEERERQEQEYKAYMEYVCVWGIYGALEASKE